MQVNLNQNIYSDNHATYSQAIAISGRLPDKLKGCLTISPGLSSVRRGRALDPAHDFSFLYEDNMTYPEEDDYKILREPQSRNVFNHDRTGKELKANLCNCGYDKKRWSIQ